jgi:hypothetical protein
VAEGTLELELTNVRGAGVQDYVRVHLYDLSNGRAYNLYHPVNRILQIKKLKAEPVAHYAVTLYPRNYRVMNFGVMIIMGQTAKERVVLPVEPSRVSRIAAPAFSSLPDQVQTMLNRAEVAEFPSLTGEPLYEALESQPDRKACLLNLAAKASSVSLGDGSTCLDHLGGLLQLQCERFFARATPALADQVGNSSAFSPADPSLHAPLAGFQIVSSFKTRDDYGNLQLTFMRNGDDWAVDADIDDARGVLHLFQVARNFFTEGSSPYDIRDVLLAHQRIDPGYEFEFV